ncbi:MAG: hypothetical protein U0Q18_26655 [Bryobacteraceae bacterium]
MSTTMYTALGGMQRSEDMLDRTAARIAQFAVPLGGPLHDEVSLSDEAVALIQSKNTFTADAGAFKTADEMEQATLKLLG